MSGPIGRFLCHNTKGCTIILTSTLMVLLILYTRSNISISSKNEDTVLAVHNSLNNHAASPHSNHSRAVSKKSPSVLIIGVRKGGTRALINMLKCHPSIVAAISEVHYFDRDEKYSKGKQWYIDQMPYSSMKQTTIEKSPSYFITPVAPKRVAALFPGMKLILIVRDPIDRAVSDYTQLAHKNRYESFEEVVFLPPSGKINTKISPISVSMYDVHLKRWLMYFDLSQIHVVNGDMLISDPVSELKKTEEFLGLQNYFTDHMFYFNSTKGFFCWKKIDRKERLIPYCLGSGKGRHHVQVLNSTKQILLNFFEPHNEKFFGMIRRRFNWGP